MRQALARQLHRFFGQHALCRSRREQVELPTFTEPDGSIYRPRLSGIPLFRTVHF